MCSLGKTKIQKNVENKLELNSCNGDDCGLKYIKNIYCEAFVEVCQLEYSTSYRNDLSLYIKNNHIIHVIVQNLILLYNIKLGANV